MRHPTWLASGAAPPNVLQLLLTLTLLVHHVSPYLLLVKDSTAPGNIIFDSSVYKLGSERHYVINPHRTANFVHHLFHVDEKKGTVSLKKRLRCDGVLYPNLFTVYIDSTSNRIRDVNYYSLPLRIVITGGCGHEDEQAQWSHSDEEFDNEHLDDEDLQAEDSDFESEDYYHREKRDVHFEKQVLLENKPFNSVDVRLLEDSEFSIVNRHKREVYNEEEDYYTFQIAHLRKSRRKRNYPFDMSIHVKLSVAKQWISETYASFPIPTADKWNPICLKESQYINSLSSFLPKTVMQHCKITFVDVDDLRFKIESTQGDLVASDDLCIQEQLWKVTILFSYKCDIPNIVDMEHRLKIVYHHQEFNDTDIAKRVRRELRNQSPFFDQALYVVSVAEEQEPGALVTTVRARLISYNIFI